MKASGHKKNKLQLILITVVICAATAVYALPCSLYAAAQAEKDKSLAVDPPAIWLVVHVSRTPDITTT